jgi:hypothetical protein
MKYEEIEKIIKTSENPTVRISFKNRNAIKGIFIKSADYKDLSRKNLWRIVTEKYIQAYNESNSENLAKIFNGTEFTKLELL